MKLTVYNHLSDTERVFVGELPQLIAELSDSYPELDIKPNEPIEDIVDDLHQQQHLDVDLDANYVPHSHDDYVFTDDDEHAFENDVEFEPLEHDSIQTLLEHDDPVERLLALKNEGVRSHHLVHAINDPHPEVRAFAAGHGYINASTLMTMLEVVQDPETANLLLGHDSCEDAHVEYYLNKFPQTHEEADGGQIE